MCRHDEQPRQEGTGEEAGGRRLEEAELAAKVGSRRAAAAEAEVERLQRMLAEAEKRSESLAWQVPGTPFASGASFKPCMGLLSSTPALHLEMECLAAAEHVMLGTLAWNRQGQSGVCPLLVSHTA